MYKWKRLFGLFICMALLVGCSSLMQAEENVYYKIPEHAIRQGAVGDCYGLIEEPITLEQDGVSIVSGYYDESDVILCLQFDQPVKLLNDPGDDFLEAGAVKIGDRQWVGCYDADRTTMFFSIYDEEYFPVDLTQEELSQPLQLDLGTGSAAYPISMKLIEPVEKLEELGTVVRESGIAVVFIPEQEGIMIQAFNEKRWGKNIEVKDWLSLEGLEGLDAEGNVIFSVDLIDSSQSYCPLTAQQQTQIAQFTVRQVELSLRQIPEQQITVPIKFTEDGEVQPFAFKLYGLFPMELYKAQFSEKPGYAENRWELKFQHLVEDGVQLTGWQIKDISHYIGNSPATKLEYAYMSKLGFLAEPEQMIDQAIQLEIEGVDVLQFGPWVYQCDLVN